MYFQYCPDCGQKLKKKEIGDEGMVPWCENCKKPWFAMFSTCVIGLVINEYREVALLRQSYISEQYHNLVSGYMKPGETAEETMTREIKEEIGITIQKLEFQGTYWYAKKDMLMIAFFAYAPKKDFVLSGEVNTAEWIPIEQVLSKVHPKGSVSYALMEAYFRKENSCQQ